MDEELTWADLATWADDPERPRGTKLALAKALGMDPSYFTRKMRSNDHLSTRQASQFRRFKAVGAPADEGPGQAHVASVKRYPVYGFRAGEEDRVSLAQDRVLEWVELPLGMDPGGEVVLIRQVGGSMEPRLFEGEVCVVQLNAPPLRDRDALIEFHDTTGVVKIYRGQRDGRVFFDDYSDERRNGFDASTVKAVHRVWARL